MADEQPPVGPSSARSSSHSGSFSPLRAALVLVFFVVATLILVGVGTRPAVIGAPTTAPSTTTTLPGGTTTTAAGGAAAGATTTTTTTPSTTTTTHHSGHGRKGATTTTTTVPHSSVSVVVANGTSTTGLAAKTSATIGAGGWAMQTPLDANTSEATSAVYYAAGQQQAAASIATTIGVAPTAVLPLTSATPVTYPPNTDVVVVVGQDIAAKSG
jgi:cytoskeletal protein RodZ